jgi:hypothetical protein
MDVISLSSKFIPLSRLPFSAELCCLPIAALFNSYPQNKKMLKAPVIVTYTQSVCHIVCGGIIIYNRIYTHVIMVFKSKSF